MTRADMQQIAVAMAHQYELDPALVCAMCHHESGGWRPSAVRYEPAFYDRYIRPMERVERFGSSISEVTERHLRAMSFGLMQVMGQVAREHGFMGEYLTDLCSPDIGIEYGCRRLRQAFDRRGNETRLALLDYNGGANPAYPDFVLRYLDEYRRVA